MICRDDLTEHQLSNVFVSEMDFIYRNDAILKERLFTAVMNFSQVNQHIKLTHDVDWSPTIDLGHNKIDGDKLKDAQERAERAKFPGKNLA